MILRCGWPVAVAALLLGMVAPRAGDAAQPRVAGVRVGPLAYGTRPSLADRYGGRRGKSESSGGCAGKASIGRGDTATRQRPCLVATPGAARR